MDRAHTCTRDRSSSFLRIGGAALLAMGFAAVVACGDSGADSLMSGRAGRGGPGEQAGPNGSTVNGSGGGGSSGGIGGGSGGGVDDAGVPLPKSEQMFRALQTSIVGACGGPGGGCHVSGAYQSNQTPVWLGNPDPYASIKKYPGIIVADPYSSKLLIKGPHEGPDFTGPNKALGDQVLAWLTEEALELKSTPLPSSAPFTVATGPNVVDVSGAGAGLGGAKVTFTASISGDILTLSNLSLTAPPSTALHVVHPLFAVVGNGQDQADPVDSLSNVDQTVPAATTSQLGPGTVILEGIASGAQLKIEFTKIEASTVGSTDGGTVGGGGGCKSVAQFTANAVPAIQNNQCLNCHGGAGGSGYGSLDLSQVGKNDTAACAQALTRVNLGNKQQSDILLAPTGGVAAHPFQGADANYKTMMLNWINNE